MHRQLNISNSTSDKTEHGDKSSKQSQKSMDMIELVYTYKAPIARNWLK